MILTYLKKVGYTVASVAALVATANVVEAQQAGTSASSYTDASLQARIERLERQNQELMRALENLQATRSGTAESASNVQASDKVTPDGTAQVQKIVADYLAEREATKKQEDEAKKAKQADEWYRIGSDLAIKAKFDDNGYPWFYTANEDFKLHIGAWMHYDNVFWNQAGGLKTPQDGRPGHAQGVASGAPLGGIGDLEDGTFFRRVRPFLEGTFWETCEYRLNLALENDQFSTTGLDEFWVAVNKVPFIGTVRVGHVKDAVGFEADMTGSSRTMTFMERSSYSEAIELNENFVTGIWLNNNFFDKHMTYTYTAFRQDQATASGAFFGDGQWGMQGRLTYLPIYECDGREWLHLGISGGWRNGTNDISVSPFRTFRLRARPELRDDDPAGGGGGILTDANSNRMIDTGLIAASDEFLAGLEFAYVRGPFSVQAEYGWCFIDDAVGIAPTGLTFHPAIVPPQDYMFNGGYIQVAYTLTGESRAYDRNRGTLAREYFKGGPFSNAFLVWDDGCHWCSGCGAWEVAARYSYTDLNNGSGLNRIQGGIMDGVSVALNWYLNTNLSCMFDWVYNRRYDLPPGTVPGFTSGYGMRVQLTF
jgi:phosphate-selective porin OprO/OprP